MTKLKTLRVTDALWSRVKTVEYARQFVGGGCEGSISPSQHDLLVLELGDELLRELAEQAAAADARQAALAQLPKPAPAVVVEVSLQRKRRRA